MALTLDVQHQERGFVVATHADLVVGVWGRKLAVRDIERLAVLERLAIAEHGQFVNISVLRAGIDLTIDEDVRAFSQEILREFANTQIASAIVVEGGGLGMVLIRSVVTSVLLLSRSPVKQRVFAKVDEAARWLVELPGAIPDLADVEALCAALRAVGARV